MENLETSALHGARPRAVKSYEPITVGGIILILSVKEVAEFVGIAAAVLGLTVVYRQVGGSSKKYGSDSDGNPRYRFRLVVKEKSKEK